MPPHLVPRRHGGAARRLHRGAWFLDRSCDGGAGALVDLDRRSARRRVRRHAGVARAGVGRGNAVERRDSRPDVIRAGARSLRARGLSTALDESGPNPGRGAAGGRRGDDQEMLIACG